MKERISFKDGRSEKCDKASTQSQSQWPNYSWGSKFALDLGTAAEKMSPQGLLSNCWGAFDPITTFGSLGDRHNGAEIEGDKHHTSSEVQAVYFRFLCSVPKTSLLPDYFLIVDTQISIMNTFCLDFCLLKSWGPKFILDLKFSQRWLLWGVL